MQDDRLEGDSISPPDTRALQTPNFSFPGFPVLPDKRRGSLGTVICFHKTRSRRELNIFFLVLFPGAEFDIFLQSWTSLCVECSRQAPGEPGKLSSKQEDPRQVFIMSSRVSYGETEEGTKH